MFCKGFQTNPSPNHLKPTIALKFKNILSNFYIFHNQFKNVKSMIYGESILLSYKLQLYLKHVDQPKIPVFLYLENIIINIFTDYYFIITINY